MEYVIGLDLGTSTCKALAINLQGQLIDSVTGQFSTSHHQPGWAEQDPQLVWKTAAGVLNQLVSKISGAPLALGLSAAMHSLLLVDSQGEPLTPAATWADQRSVPQAARLRQQEKTAQPVYARTGCPPTWVYYPSRLLWWRENEPTIFRHAYRFCGLKEWFLYRLTQRWATDLGMASTTGLFDLYEYDWDPGILEQTLVHPLRLPEIYSQDEFIGEISAAAAAATGLPAGLPVAAGSSDGGLANLGAGAVDPGQQIITVGTSGSLRNINSRPAVHPQDQTWCYLLYQNCYHIGGAINNAGLAVEWVLNRLYPKASSQGDFSPLFEEASQVSPGSAGLIFLPYFIGERSPHWNPSLRAQIFGLGIQHGRAQIARAVLEGVAFCLADVHQALASVKLQPNPAPDRPILLTGSILHSPAWVQILADVLGRPLMAIDGPESSTFGAALCAIAALEDRPVENIARQLAQKRPASQVNPDSQAHARYRIIHARFQELYQETYPPGR